MRRFVLAVAVFVALAMAGALTPACGDDEGTSTTPTPTPTDAELSQLLAELPAQTVLSLAFPGVVFQPLLPSQPALTFFMPAHPGAQQEVLGHLTGYLTQKDQPQLATFLYLREGSGGQELDPALGLEEGLYMILVGTDHGQPALAGVTMLEATAQEFLEFTLAQEEGRRPFRQGVDNLIANGAISPAVASDVDGDGIDELILLDSGVSEGAKAALYLTYDWSGADLSWRRIDPPGGAGARLPSTTVLDYLATVEAAAGTAATWDGTPRVLAWEWLSTTPPGPVSAELLAQLALDSDPDAQDAARRKLEATRTLLETAYWLLSVDWRQRQPWTDFVYGFRNSTGVRIEKLLPPRQEGKDTLVEVSIIAESREGSTSVGRRFRVVYSVVEEASGWRLDHADAREEAP